MKFLNKKQKNNKGFSLVELIVVIAIMVVLVAVLAPVFSKYIESSRRSTDVQNANSIAESVLADVADNAEWYKNLNLAKDASTDPINAEKNKPTAIKDDIVSKGNTVNKGDSFYFVYDSKTNKCAVYVGDDRTYNLAMDEDADGVKGAQSYKNYED